MDKGSLSLIAGVAVGATDMAFFSVVISVLNQVATLTDSLASLYQQTYRDFEVIAVDGGSTDGSYQLLEQHAGKGRLRLYRQDEGGAQEARNFGAEQARAAWLVFFDADSILLFDHLSRLADAIGKHADIELFVNAYQQMEGHRRLPRTASLPSGVTTRREALAAIAQHDFIHTGATCIRRGRFLALGGFPLGGLRDDGDIYFWLKVLCELAAIHYDNTVTCLWLSDDRNGNRDAGEPAPPRSDAEWLAQCSARLSWREARYLRATINRKVLARAARKKRLGLSVKAELAAISLSGLGLSHCARVAVLMLPQSCYERYRK
ncbi:glycosyltransferase family 2 protein [Billgrantia desiderata]|uniref:glycosyltransferase family 2 protein n=1 Tax=Billgrantia desiderata TaxID=52021 RepID=UPI0011B0DF7D|nr:glycosyltransferase family 2 protein [Halomonas desiderata]